VQFWAPDDGRKNRLKHVERSTDINKLWNFAYCWLYFAPPFGFQSNKIHILIDLCILYVQATLKTVLYSYQFYLLIVGIEGYCYTWSHTWAHTLSVGLLWTKDRSLAEASTSTTQQVQDTNTHAPGEIWTSSHNKRALRGLRLRPRDKRNRLN